MKWAVVFFQKPIFRNAWAERFHFLKRFLAQPIVFIISSRELPFLSDVNLIKWIIYRTTTSSGYACYMLVDRKYLCKISGIKGSVIELKDAPHCIGINVENPRPYTVSYFENCRDTLNRFPTGATLLKRDDISSHGFLFNFEQTAKGCVVLGAPADDIPRWTVSQFRYRYKSDVLPECPTRRCQMQTNL